MQPPPLAWWDTTSTTIAQCACRFSWFSLVKIRFYSQILNDRNSKWKKKKQNQLDTRNHSMKKFHMANCFIHLRCRHRRVVHVGQPMLTMTTRNCVWSGPRPKSSSQRFPIQSVELDSNATRDFNSIIFYLFFHWRRRRRRRWGRRRRRERNRFTWIFWMYRTLFYSICI